jgi:Family of unknown function (DUF6600)
MSGIAALALIGGAVPIDGSQSPLLAQVEHRTSTIDFHAALGPHGRWEHHNRWGEVWAPADRPRDWRPYTRGHWAYTDEWGWYWISDGDEQDWGWVAFHYGRWVYDPDMGWIWIRGTEWGPAWVGWRRGEHRVGWAPLAPDEVLVEVEQRPQEWVFVHDSELIAPRIVDVILPEREYDAYIHETVVVNRTVVEDRERIAVNPGIEPEYVAAAVGHPLRPVEVRPPVRRGKRDRSARE